MKSTRRSTLLALAIAALIFVPEVSAQSNYGAIRGLLTDPQDAVVARANVTLVDEASQIERSTETKADGEYTFSAVAPGAYVVRVTAGAFATG